LGDRQIVSQNQVAIHGPAAFTDRDIPRSTGVNRDGCRITPIPHGHVFGSVIVGDIETNFEAGRHVTIERERANGSVLLYNTRYSVVRASVSEEKVGRGVKSRRGPLPVSSRVPVTRRSSGITIPRGAGRGLIDQQRERGGSGEEAVSAVVDLLHFFSPSLLAVLKL